MVRMSIEQLQSLMGQADSVRSLSIIAHVDHGKSSITECLLHTAGIIRQIATKGESCHTDSHEEEAARGITIKSTGVSLCFELGESLAKTFPHLPPSVLVNIIDSPGHVEFSSEVTAALRVTDGALVVVDCVEGVCVQTETVVRQALAERIRPVLVINKIDRFFVELRLQPEEMYQSLQRTIRHYNSLVGEQDQVDPLNGSVCFAAAKGGWGFSLPQIARRLAAMAGGDADKMLRRLWGDTFFNAKTGKWSKKPIDADGVPLERGFCRFVIRPLQQMMAACMAVEEVGNTDSAWADLDKLLTRVDVTLKPKERELTGVALQRVVLPRWWPIHLPLLEAIVVHLPSPAKAQAYRTEVLYTGPMDDDVAASMRACNPEGPLVVYISKMVKDPRSRGTPRFLAFGRVFSGTIRGGMKVDILGANYDPDSNPGDHVQSKTVQSVSVMVGPTILRCGAVPAGNTVTLAGIDQFLLKTGTIVDANSQGAFPLRTMKFSINTVMQRAVEPKNPSQLPKVVEALKMLSKGDPLVKTSVTETGECIIAGSGFLHLEICCGDLQRYIPNVELTYANPIVTYLETITEPSERCLAKSANKHNRLWMHCDPLGEELVEDIIAGRIKATDDAKVRTRTLVEQHNWDINLAKKIWCYGPEGSTAAASVLVDDTKGVANMNEIRDSVNAAFQWATTEGVLADQELRGARFVVLDAQLHADAIHRGGGQIIPTTRRVMRACQLTAKPRLVEPFYRLEVTCPTGVSNSIYGQVERRRGQIVEEIMHAQLPNTVVVVGHIPVAESMDISEALRACTSGRAFASLSFDHWRTMQSDPLEEGSQAHKLVTAIRKRKGLDLAIPPLARFKDTL